MTREEKEEANLRLAKKMLCHLGKDEFPEILEMLTATCEFHVGSERTRGIVPWHGVHVGHDQINTYLNRRAQYLHRDNCGSGLPQQGGKKESEPSDGISGDIEYIVGGKGGDTVVAIGRLRDSFKEPEPRSHMCTTDFVLVFRIVRGEIAKFQYFHDTDAVVQAWLTKYPGGRLAREP
jgi:hypothetical protein